MGWSGPDRPPPAVEPLLAGRAPPRWSRGRRAAAPLIAAVGLLAASLVLWSAADVPALRGEFVAKLQDPAESIESFTTSRGVLTINTGGGHVDTLAAALNESTKSGVWAPVLGPTPEAAAADVSCAGVAAAVGLSTERLLKPNCTQTCVTAFGHTDGLGAQLGHILSGIVWAHGNRTLSSYEARPPRGSSHTPRDSEGCRNRFAATGRAFKHTAMVRLGHPQDYLGTVTTSPTIILGTDCNQRPILSIRC